MNLGAFSISLAVKNLDASRKFYEKFGFQVFGGDPSQNWLILKNGDHIIGLFQGMFDKNVHPSSGVKLGGKPAVFAGEGFPDGPKLSFGRLPGGLKCNNQCNMLPRGGC